MFTNVFIQLRSIAAFALFLCLLFSSTVIAAPGDIKWTYDTENVASFAACPAINDQGTIYVGSSNKYIYAINADGSLKWRTELDDECGKRSVVIGPDGTLYLGTLAGTLYAINPSDGSVKWKKAFSNEVTSSVGIDADGTLYVGNADNHLYALNQAGTVKWKFETGGDIFGSPVIDSDGTIYFGSKDNKLYALNLDGTQKWAYTTSGSVESSPAIASDGTLYVGSVDEYVYAINSDGTLKWTYATGGDLYSSAVIGADGTIYIGSADKKLYALNADGTLKWSYDTAKIMYESAAVVGADGTVYIAAGTGGPNQGGELFALSSDGALKWATDLGIGPDRATSPIAMATDGTLYIISWDNNLYAVEGNSGGLADSPWPKYLKNRKNNGRDHVVSSSASSSQAPGVSVTMTSVKANTKTAAQIQTAYKGLTGFTPCNDVVTFNATVTADANATFYMESNKLNGTVSEFWLYKLKNGAPLPFEGYSLAHNNYTNGIWWITDEADSVQNKSAILNQGTTYRIYYCIKDNGEFDLNATAGFITDPVVLGRSSITGGPNQPAGVLVSVTNAVRRDALPGDMAVYGGYSSFQPMADFAAFNGTVSPVNSTGVFRFNSTALSGAVADLQLLKLFESNFSVREYGQYAPSDVNSTDGAWWLTYRNNTYIPFNATLMAGTNYFVNFVVQDNGPYDADPTLGAITDPVALGTPEASSSTSSGCTMNPAAGFGLEWLLLLLSPFVAIMRRRK